MSIFTNLVGGPWLYLAAFLAGSAAGTAGGYKAKDFVDRPRISRLEVSFAKSQTDLADSEVRYKSREAQIEADRAEVNRKALEGIQAQAAESARLRGELALALSRARQMASRALTAALRRAEADKVSNALSPAALAYLASVRAGAGHAMKMARAALSLAILLAGCQSMPVKPLEPIIEFKTLLQFPVIDPDLLMCPREPILAENVMSDALALLWAEQVRQAGKACRANVDALRELVSKWPKP